MSTRTHWLTVRCPGCKRERRDKVLPRLLPKPRHKRFCPPIYCRECQQRMREAKGEGDAQR